MCQFRVLKHPPSKATIEGLVIGDPTDAAAPPSGLPINDMLAVPGGVGCLVVSSWPKGQSGTLRPGYMRVQLPEAKEDKVKAKK